MKKVSKSPEIIFGLVAPIGTQIQPFQNHLEHLLKKMNYEMKIIRITDCLEKLLPKNRNLKKIKSLNTYYKMEACTAYRKMKGPGYFAGLALKQIQTVRSKTVNKRTAYLIVQLKNVAEHEILQKTYGENYIQISCFSNYENRKKTLQKKYQKDPKISQKIRELANQTTETLKNIDHNMAFNYHKLQPEIINNLLQKDFADFEHPEKDTAIKTHGQGISTLFDKSHFFVNLDQPSQSIKAQIKKIVDLLFGQHEEYPTADEFGMAVAYNIARRSNFPGDRQVGACIVSEHGEIISAGSIRAPASHANPKKSGQDSIQNSYEQQLQRRNRFKNLITEIKTKTKHLDEQDKNALEQLKQFIHNNLEFHPCTHAEMSAISDAAKLGVSIRGATLYSTTFPCHMCSKDIITSGINKVVFLEAFPKSKNEELYSKVIDIDPNQQSPNKVPFYTFFGVGPKRYNTLYSLENSQTLRKRSVQNPKPKKNLIPPLLKFRVSDFYEHVETTIIKHINRGKKTPDPSFVFRDLLY